jgi:regulator of PEP synthase PpsR (kinase-PPPase family)
MIVFTLVRPEQRQLLLQRAADLGVPTVDIMGPMIRALADKLEQTPKLQPGLARQLDEEYFRRVEAIEFAVKYDDGRDSRGILRADVVLIGVSRTSKTPLSMYLAHKRYKVANVPLIPEVEPPEELFQIPPSQCIGLTIKPEALVRIRSERLKALGLTSTASYANPERIAQELAYADEIMRRIGCPVIDVSNKAVEETANLILEQLRQRGTAL